MSTNSSHKELIKKATLSRNSEIRSATTTHTAVLCPNCKGFLTEENKALLNYCKKLEQMGILKKVSDRKPIQWNH